MVPPIRYFLVGGYLESDTSRKDIDLMGMLGEKDFELIFGYTHESLQKAYREESTEKLRKYLHANKVTGWVLSSMFGKKVDFKWIPPTMLYNPCEELYLEADVTMYL